MNQIRFAAGALMLEVEADVGRLTIDRRDRRNAINGAVWDALPDVLSSALDRRDVKVLILCGRGGHFAAGADITEFDAVFADRVSASDYLARMSRALDALESFGKPTIASIEGSCIGAGLGIALACDLRMAAVDARLGVTPARLGLLYSLNDTRRLVAAIGTSAAKDLLFTGRIIDATTARAIGLVGEVHAGDVLHHAVLEKARQIAAVSQWSVRHAKRVVAEITRGVVSDTDTTRQWFVDAIETGDYLEGLAAFRAKRPPDFPFR